MIRTFLDGLYLFAGYLAGAFLIVIFLLMMALSLGREVGREHSGRATISRPGAWRRWRSWASPTRSGRAR